MKVQYQTATISFSPELTRPDARSVPVAVLLVGAAEEVRFAAVVALVPVSGTGMDPISYEVLGDVPGLLRDHVDRVMGSLPADAGIETILTTLHRRLRNSLFVSAIDPPAELELKDEMPETIALCLLGRASEEMQALLQNGSGRPSRVPSSAQPPSTILRGTRLPSLCAWPLLKQRSSEVRA